MNRVACRASLVARTTWVVPMTVLAVVIEVAGILGRGRYWVGVWPQASLVVGWPMMYVAAIVAAAACLSAQARVRSQSEPVVGVGVRARWRVEAAAIVPALAVGLVALVAGVVTVTVISWDQRGPGWLWPGYLIAPVALIGLAAGAGHLVGLLVATPWVVPVVAAGVFGVAIMVPVFVVLDGNPSLSPHLPAALLAAIGAVAALVAAVVVPADTHRQPLRVAPRRVVGVVGGCVVLAAVILSAAVPVQVQRTLTGEPLCTSSDPQLCLWPDSRRWLDDASETALAIVEPARAHGLTVPARIDEFGLPGATSMSSTTLTTGMGRWDIADSVAFSIMAASTRGCPASPDLSQAEAEAYSTAYYSLQYWLTTIAAGPMPAGVHASYEGMLDRPLIEALPSGDPDVQDAWVSAQLGVLGRGC